MPLRKIFELDELSDLQKKILLVMDEDKPCLESGIVERLFQQEKEKVTLRALTKNMKTLEDKKYVDKKSSDLREWTKIRDDPLVLDYVDAKVYMGEARSRLEFIWKYMVEYVRNNKESCDKYARAYKEVVKAKKKAREKEQEFRRIGKEIQK